jgi:hypothetical protein
MWWSHVLAKQLFEPSNIDVDSQTALLLADARNIAARLERVAPIVSELEVTYACHLGTPVESLIGAS